MQLGPNSNINKVIGGNHRYIYKLQKCVKIRCKTHSDLKRIQSKAAPLVACQCGRCRFCVGSNCDAESWGQWVIGGQPITALGSQTRRRSIWLSLNQANPLCFLNPTPSRSGYKGMTQTIWDPHKGAGLVAAVWVFSTWVAMSPQPLSCSWASPQYDPAGWAAHPRPFSLTGVIFPIPKIDWNPPEITSLNFSLTFCHGFSIASLHGLGGTFVGCTAWLVFIAVSARSSPEKKKKKRNASIVQADPIKGALTSAHETTQAMSSPLHLEFTGRYDLNNIHHAFWCFMICQKSSLTHLVHVQLTIKSRTPIVPGVPCRDQEFLQVVQDLANRGILPWLAWLSLFHNLSKTKHVAFQASQSQAQCHYIHLDPAKKIIHLFFPHVLVQFKFQRPSHRTAPQAACKPWPLLGKSQLISLWDMAEMNTFTALAFEATWCAKCAISRPFAFCWTSLSTHLNR